MFNASQAGFGTDTMPRVHKTNPADTAGSDALEWKEEAFAAVWNQHFIGTWWQENELPGDL